MQSAHGSFGEHAAVPPKNAAPQTSSFSYPPTPRDWTQIQRTIYQYYVLQNQPLHSVREFLRKDHGFKASERMIKARLAKWNYIKNAKREDWGYLAILHEKRKKENKPSTIFEIRGHRKTVKDLQRFIRNQNISPEKFLAESVDNFRGQGKPIPEYIRACTPDPEDLLYSPSADTSLSEVRSPSPTVVEPTRSFFERQPLQQRHQHHDNVDDHDKGHEYQHQYQQQSQPPPPPALPPPPPLPDRSSTDEFFYYSDPAKSVRDNFEHECPFNSYDTESSQSSYVKSTHSSMSSPPSTPHQRRLSLAYYSSERARRELEACSTQLLNPTPLKSKMGHNHMPCWSIMQKTSSAPAGGDSVEFVEYDTCVRRFPSLNLFEPSHGQRNILDDSAATTLRIPSTTREEGSWVWVSLCFLACIALTRGDEKFATKVLEEAANKLERLLRAQDPLLLTAAGLMITVLHQHDQEDIAVRILHSAKSVADRTLSETDPIRATISYLALTSDSSGKLLAAAAFSSIHLQTICQSLEVKYGKIHPYVIAARYNFAWMLKWEGQQVMAEEQARQAHAESLREFGPMHMQTVTCLSVIAGCINLEPEGRIEECIEAYRVIIRDASRILGIIHPYTLEAQRRLAHLIEKNVPSKTNVVLKLHRTILFGRLSMLGRNHRFTIAQKDCYTDFLRRHHRWEDQHGCPSKERREIDEIFTKDPEESWELVSRIDDDFCIADVPTESTSFNREGQEEEWCRLAMAKSLSRSGSPTSNKEYQAY